MHIAKNLAAIAMFGAASAVQAADHEDQNEGARIGPEGQTMGAPAQRKAAEPKALEDRNIRTEGRGGSVEPLRDGQNPAIERAERRDNTEDDKTSNSKDR